MAQPVDSRLLTAYYSPERVVVNRRNSVALMNWAQEISTEDIPNDVDDDWVRLRLLADRIQPSAGPEQQYVLLTKSYFLADEDTQTNIRQYCSDMNSEAEEVSLTNQTAAVLRRFVDRFAATQVTSDQIAAWYLDNDVDPPEDSRVFERVRRLREMKAAGEQTYGGL